jgi:hypothetical protein
VVIDYGIAMVPKTRKSNSIEQVMSSSPDLNYGRFSKETMKLTQMVSKTRQTYVMDKSMKLKRMVDSDGAEKYH